MALPPRTIPRLRGDGPLAQRKRKDPGTAFATARDGTADLLAASHAGAGAVLAVLLPPGDLPAEAGRLEAARQAQIAADAGQRPTPYDAVLRGRRGPPGAAPCGS
jgi:hypothetical protein